MMRNNRLIDYKELKLQIKRVFDTQEAFADAMEMNKTALNQRLNNSVAWKSSEMVNACELLGIPLDQAHIYFLQTK